MAILFTTCAAYRPDNQNLDGKRPDGERLFGLPFTDAARHAAALAGGSILIDADGENIVIMDAFGEILAESENKYAARVEAEMFAAIEIGDIPTAKALARDLDRVRPFGRAC